jgi:predicted ABC-type ATPase
LTKIWIRVESPAMPNLFIIAGPNGAGKTTYVKRFLRQEMKCREFVNADLIAAGLSPFAPDEAAFDAGRIMLKRVRDLFAQRKDFSFETTLTGYGYMPLLREMKEAGYRIHLDYLWIRVLDITRSRVKQRVKKGGHDIPDAVQLRRFAKGLRFLLDHYRPLVHDWRIYDNTGDDPHLVIEEEDGRLRVRDASLLAQLETATNLRIMANKPTDRVEEPAAAELSWETRASMRAMRLAYADVILENKAWGLPIIQWREGRGVVEVPAEQLEPLARRILETNGEPLPEAEERALLAHLKV